VAGALVVAVSGVTLAGVPAGAASTADGVPSGEIVVDGQEVPVRGSFTYHDAGYVDRPEVGGLVHGVRRVEGGTVLYFSIGVAPDTESGVFTGTEAFASTGSGDYPISYATRIDLVDEPGSRMYRVLSDGGTTGFATDVREFDSEVGTLQVAWAMFAELPSTTTSVDVRMPNGAMVPNVPVEDGVLEPVVDDAVPFLGQGWPEVPQGAELEAAVATTKTYTLVRREGDLEAVALTDETPEAVAVTLDANVLFASGSADLTPESQAALAAVAADIAARGTGEVLVTGHTDADGSDSFNQTLSEQRAAAVLAVLQPASGGAVTFRSVGKGETEPLAGNDSDEGKQANRRVTVGYQVTGGGER
jgi:outer membrane protein OmpA-like peptidoglycan-associated protein